MAGHAASIACTRPIQRGDVAGNRALELKPLPLAQDGNAVITHGSAHDDAVRRPGACPRRCWWLSHKATPEVLMKSLSAACFSTTLVSPHTMVTPASAAASAHGCHHSLQILDGKPSSIMKSCAEGKAVGPAAWIGRSQCRIQQAFQCHPQERRSVLHITVRGKSKPDPGDSKRAASSSGERAALAKCAGRLSLSVQ